MSKKTFNNNSICTALTISTKIINIDYFVQNKDNKLSSRGSEDSILIATVHGGDWFSHGSGLGLVVVEARVSRPTRRRQILKHTLCVLR